MPSRAGYIDLAIDPAYIGLADQDSGAAKGLALVAHPHPLFGGSRDNKVVMTIARALTAAGFHVLRPNFRGVGESSGTFDEGLGEAEDLLSLLRSCAEADPPAWWPNHPALAWPKSRQWVLGGFSFGAFVQTKLLQSLSDPLSEDVKNTTQLALKKELILVGTAVTRFAAATVPSDSLVIHGEVDDVIALADVLNWARPQHLPVLVIPGAGHFFHGELPVLKRAVSDFLRGRDKSVQ